MIYLDTSVALAHLLSEDRVPPAELWDDRIVSSRLLEYELWTRVHARGLGRSHGEAVRALLDRVALVELSPVVLARALAPMPGAVRILGALHLATADFLRTQGQLPRVATYDTRMADAARRLGLALADC